MERREEGWLVNRVLAGRAPVEEAGQGKAHGGVVGLSHAEEGEEEVGGLGVGLEVRGEAGVEAPEVVPAGVRARGPDAVHLSCCDVVGLMSGFREEVSRTE